MTKLTANGDYPEFGGWKYFVGEDMPGEGWKLHVGGSVETAQTILNCVSPLLRESKVTHKFLPTVESITEQTGGQKGKWFAVYPTSIMFAFVIVSEIDAALKAKVPLKKITPVPVEQKVGAGYVFTRYGAFNSVIYDPSSGRYVNDSIGKLKPDWIKNPWNFYSISPNWAALSKIEPWHEHDKRAYRKRGR